MYVYLVCICWNVQFWIGLLILIDIVRLLGRRILRRLDVPRLYACLFEVVVYLLIAIDTKLYDRSLSRVELEIRNVYTSYVHILLYTRNKQHSRINMPQQKQICNSYTTYQIVAIIMSKYRGW